MVVAGHPLEKGVAVLGCAKASLDGLACRTNTAHGATFMNPS
jgi:hypothetical protein